MPIKSHKKESSALYTALLQLGLTAQEAGLYVLSLEI